MPIRKGPEESRSTKGEVHKRGDAKFRDMEILSAVLGGILVWEKKKSPEQGG